MINEVAGSTIQAALLIDGTQHQKDSIYRVFIKNCVFSKFTATHPLQVGEELVFVRDLSEQSLLLADHFLYNQ